MKKIEEVKMEFVPFDSGDVIATSGSVVGLASKNIIKDEDLIETFAVTQEEAEKIIEVYKTFEFGGLKWNDYNQ